MRIKPEVIKALEAEREYQEQKWPASRPSAGEWLLIMQKCLDDARRAWVTGRGDEQVLYEIRQVAACGVAALEQWGAPTRERCGRCARFFSHRDLYYDDDALVCRHCLSGKYSQRPLK
jgi:formylmethanofuran dehydrogenase subunit E